MQFNRGLMLGIIFFFNRVGGGLIDGALIIPNFPYHSLSISLLPVLLSFLSGVDVPLY
jgi:hypothetical protein